MKKSERITQRDLAARLGLSQGTVSRALARSPLIPKETQELVLNAAKDLSYLPDPVLSCLNAYRQTRMPIEKGQTLAWIVGVNQNESPPWLQGVQDQAPRYGYRLTQLDPDKSQLSAKRMMSILYNQGISGLIFAPRHDPYSQLNIDLSKFCAVTIGYTLREPVIDRVITDHYANCITAYNMLYANGYRRIGYAYNRTANPRIEGREQSAFLYQQRQKPDAILIPPAPYINSYEGTRTTLLPWLEQWTPDAIICDNIYLPAILEEIGIKVPRDISIVSLAVKDTGDERSGINQLAYEAGMLAVDTVVALLRSNQRGIPAKRRTIMIEGDWMKGNTMAYRTAESPSA